MARQLLLLLFVHLDQTKRGNNKGHLHIEQKLTSSIDGKQIQKVIRNNN